MNTTLFPVYEDAIGGIPQIPLQGDARFHIDIRYAKYHYLHHHNFAELSYFLEGEGVESINGVGHQLKPGTVSFLLPHHMHFITGDYSRRVRKICCMFDLQLLNNSNDYQWFSQQLYGIGTTIPSFVDFSGEESRRIQDVFHHLLEEYHKADSPYRLGMISTKLNEALLLFIRTAGSQEQTNQTYTPISGEPHTERSNFLWPLLKYMNSHYMRPLTLSELSSHFCLSEPYISRIFREHFRMGFIEYLHRLRIERSVNMLLHTEMSITDIALEVGFESTRTFSRVFRELKGTSAREYRLAMR